MKVSELRDKQVDGLKQELLDSRKEQFNLLMQVRSGQNKNTAALGRLRKDIARVLTVINEKKRNEHN